MSLFSKTPTNGTTPQPAAASGSLFGKKVAASPEYDAAKIAEKAKLAAADASYGTCMCGAALTGQNTSKLQSGQIVHIGCPRAGVTPPDAPKTTLATAAAPLTAEQISKVEDPEIRQRATEHAALHAQHSAQQPATETKGGRCPKAGERVLMNEKQKMSRSITCTCGKEYKKIKDEQIDIQDTGVYWLVPSHNLPKIETPAVVAASASVATPVVAPVAAPVATAVAQQSMILYVDVVVERGLQPTPLEDYITNIVRTIEKQGNVPDLRFAPNGHELAFGRWKGALAACVRFTPPQPGAYFVSSSNSEIKQVVIEALIPFCDAVYRGVR